MDNRVDLNDPFDVLDWLRTFTNKTDRHDGGDHWLYPGWETKKVNCVQGKFPLKKVAYELVHHPIPDRTHIESVCGVPSCVNPRHLRVRKTKHIKPEERRPWLDLHPADGKDK